MNKIPTVFERNYQTHEVTDRVTPGCEWVLAGEGVPTRKYDGTCVVKVSPQGKWADGWWWARREVKKGKVMPEGFVAVHYDETTSKTMGLEPIEQSSFYKFFCEALAHEGWEHPEIDYLPEGTYELLGPKINGNPEKREQHELVRHTEAEAIEIMPAALSPTGLRIVLGQLGDEGWEGLVWHHPDGRMAKLKAKDFR